MKNNFFILSRCDHCGEKKRKLIYNLSSQKLVQCKQCKLVFLDKMRKDYESLYDGEYYQDSEGAVNPNYSDYNDEEQITKDKFKFAYDYIKKYKTKNNTLLDVGAGFGFFLKYLPKSIKLEAVEVSSQAAQAISKNTSAKIYQKDFLAVKIQQTYDFIVSFDVIEHQLSLSSYLKKINTLLNEQGTFLFTTPDFDSIFNKILGKRAPLIQPSYHNYYLTKNWLRNNIKQYGFDIITLRTKYTDNMTVEYALFMTSLAFPIINTLRMIDMSKKLKINKKIIPFIRLGVIQCVLVKK